MRAAKQAYENKEITREEYDKIIEESLEADNDWITFILEFEDAIGYPIDFAVELVDNAIKLHGKQDFTF